MLGSWSPSLPPVAPIMSFSSKRVVVPRACVKQVSCHWLPFKPSGTSDGLPLGEVVGCPDTDLYMPVERWGRG